VSPGRGAIRHRRQRLSGPALARGRQRYVWGDRRTQAEGHLGRLVAEAHEGEGYCLAWFGVGLSPNSPGAASRSIIGRSGASSITRGWASKNRGSQRARLPPDVAHPRMWRKYQNRTEPERLAFIQTWTRTVITDHLGSHNAKAVTPVDSHRRRQALLLVQILGGVESDRADFRRA
jgi:hypothetical protein